MRQMVLNFHGIGTPTRNLEQGETNYWVSEEFFVHTLDLIHYHRAQVQIDITFDDGNQSDLTIAAPLLRGYGLCARIFVLADRIGQPGSLDASALRDLVGQGHTIGSHGAAHIDWKAADAATLAAEIGAVTRDKIGTAAGVRVTSAALPFGRYNAAVLRALKREGYLQVYSSDGGPLKTLGAAVDLRIPGAAPWPIPRTSLRADMTLPDIEAIILGQESIHRRFRRTIACAIKARL
jgi:peptidoglycan/xylan/chitin deacetylase (PgdA/CDA1 family)